MSCSGFGGSLVNAGDRVLMVDDWIDTGATARVVRQLVDDCGASGSVPRASSTG